ncbi:heme lyase NrfEFG subunit NrfE [Pleomorphomonas diazotrophica]|uniref:Heme lyase NrfEFG subunit NrfE n=1 Tax=Pleomorphomonas diazotrophica TaxID=1166257 RepID=A0A1I4SGW1_9HYPH|nr:heme lyase CcmF/NrfE family subunit [Pleomorphomonas diazotrophica]PKR88948.1 heme lyase NrfEFG subunit NrfE [Pleomorphomonas diazotrophica]SFM63662.1 cytochrome c-type biogenesis protein CcmF [Pleomorphomonas diazotrophica]
MIVEFGHFALILALAVAVGQSILPIAGFFRRDPALMAVAPRASMMQLLLVALAFAALTYAYLVSDFSLLNVVENSHSEKPLIFKISGVWGNHEGSMLLWALILALFGAAVAAFGGNLPQTLKANVLAVQGWISTAFLAFILTTSNPFLRLAEPPMEGRDLNPVLQDVGLAIHPPLLYLGYVGFSIAFAFAIAALIEGRIDAAWARWVRPWVLGAWIFLTAGIAMGSYWAYYELGWGGFWFWDPVENASLMPWLVGTALLHSAVVMEKREALKVWTVLLAILAFSLSLLGTFLVRSGVLTSVHAFATDPARGVFILAILCLFIGGGLGLFAFRAGTLRQGGLFAPVSREGALVLNNVFLTVAAGVVLFGTLVPLIVSAFGGAISVGAPYFNTVFGPLFGATLLVVPLGPLLAWKRGDLLGALERLWAVFALAALVAVLVAWMKGETHITALFGLGVAVWVLVGAFAELVTRARFREVGLSVGLRRLAGLPRSAFGTALAHAGLGVTLLGIVATSAFQSEAILEMKPGDTATVGAYSVTFDGIRNSSGPNYSESVATMTVREGGVVRFVVEPSRRFYAARQMPTTEAGIRTHGLSQFYVTLGGEGRDSGSVVVRMWDKPLVTLIWLGALVMMAGGTLSLADRRLRVGAPKPARRATVPAE